MMYTKSINALQVDSKEKSKLSRGFFPLPRATYAATIPAPSLTNPLPSIMPATVYICIR